jgi:hypothetical protein
VTRPGAATATGRTTGLPQYNRDIAGNLIRSFDDNTDISLVHRMINSLPTPEEQERAYMNMNPELKKRYRQFLLSWEGTNR